MSDLTKAARDLVDRPPRPPVDLVELRSRIERRHRRRRGLAAGTTALVLLIGCVGYIGYRASRVEWVSTETTSKGRYPRWMVMRPRPPVARGERRVNFGDASIVVPKTWTVVEPGGGSCARFVVFLGPSVPRKCKPPSAEPEPSAVTLQVWSGRSSTPTGMTTTFNGYRALEVNDGGPGLSVWQLPDFDLRVVLNGPDARRILQSLSWSDRHEALSIAKSSAGRMPSGWRSVDYEGVQFSVPRSFKTQRGTFDPGDSCGRHAEVLRDVVYEGTSASGPVCSADVPLDELTGIDGVWIRTDDEHGGTKRALPTATPLRNVGEGSAVVLDVDPEGPDARQPILQIVVTTSKGRRVLVNVGLGPDPRVAGGIVASLRVD